MENRALTTGEIGKCCDVHFRTVLRWIERGHLKAYKLPGGRDNRIRTVDFLNFLQENNMPIPQEFKQQSRSVLIVDDDGNMAKAIKRTLQQAKFLPTVAPDALWAGVMLKNLSPRLMTLDLKMPGVDGFEILKYIRKDPELCSLKILVISGMASVDLEKALCYGADDYLAKPFDNDVLLQKVSGLM